MPVDGIRLGQVVRSNAGRDKGNIYLVVGFSAPQEAWLADGRSRRAANPKRKNVRHISVLGLIDKGVAAKLAGGLKADDEDIRQAIKACVCTGE
ncbi:MAG: hypothetical protein H6Q73_2924 [Firmicutes bacterium]|nr:hypothetical protein [Bacillota bacterium]